MNSIQAAFSQWADAASLNGELRHASSTAVYGQMWSGFTNWCAAHQQPLDTLTAGALERFLDSRTGETKLSDRYAWRMIHLIRRVLSHRSEVTGRRPNLAALDLLARRPELRYANAAHNDALPEFLSATDATRLVTYLSEVRPGRGGDTPSWREVRNRTSVGVMLGAGLTPGEVRALRMADVITRPGRANGIPWKLRVTGDDVSPDRETPTASWAGHLLRWWMTVRQAHAIAGPMLFPATRVNGKPWSKESQYKAARQVLSAAGLDATEGGSFKLRHTFALRQLRRGKSPDDVAGWLGVTDPAVMGRYQSILLGPLDLE